MKADKAPGSNTRNEMRELSLAVALLALLVITAI